MYLIKSLSYWKQREEVYAALLSWQLSYLASQREVVTLTALFEKILLRDCRKFHCCLLKTPIGRVWLIIYQVNALWGRSIVVSQALNENKQLRRCMRLTNIFIILPKIFYFKISKTFHESPRFHALR